MNGLTKLMMGLIVYLMLLTWSVSGAVLHVPGEYATIQAAVDKTETGDTVLVADGTYSGEGNRNIDLKYHNICIASENGYGECMIDCGNSGFGFVMTTGIVEGFTIRYAKGGNEGFGVYFYEGGGIVRNCVIEQCSTGVYFLYTSPAYVSNCIIRNNDVDGLFCCGGSAEAFNCIVENNGDYGVYNRSVAMTTLYNCLILGDIFTYGCAETYLHNCTVSGDVECYYEAYTSLNNSIVWPGCIWVQDETSGATAAYCNLETPYPGEGNISTDPLYTTGPHGSYYLSQTASGQPDDSPCVDAGSDLSGNVCFPSPFGSYCLDSLTTRTDTEPDIDSVDMGFHYDASLPSTPTPAPGGVELMLNDTLFEAGDPFKLRALCQGNTGDSYDLYVVLDIHGSYWFYPSWANQPDCRNIEIRADKPNYYFLLDFIWPEGDLGRESDLRFWSAMMMAGTNELYGNVSCVTFGYQ